MRLLLSVSFLLVLGGGLVACGRPLPIDAVEPRELVGTQWLSTCERDDDGAFQRVRVRYEVGEIRWAFQQHAAADCADAPSAELAVVRIGYFRRVGDGAYEFQTTEGSESETPGGGRRFAHRRATMPPLSDCRASTFHLNVAPGGELLHTVRNSSGPSATLRFRTVGR